MQHISQLYTKERLFQINEGGSSISYEILILKIINVFYYFFPVSINVIMYVYCAKINLSLDYFSYSVITDVSHSDSMLYFLLK